MSMELVRKPASSSNDGELDSSSAQTIAGAKTFTGALTPSGGIVGRTDGVAVPAGMIGERVTWASAPGNQAMTTTMTDWTNASISLSAGVWMVYANVQCIAETGTAVSNFSSANVVITDTGNAIVQEMDQQLMCRTSAAASAFQACTLAFSFLANVNSSTTYKIRVRRIDGAGTGSATVYNQGTNRSQFYAVRIA
jgi:hypothetical protein